MNSDDEKIDDHQTVLGKFVWEIVNDTCLPCLLRNADATKYVPTSVSESRVLQHYLVHFTPELLECVSIERYSLTRNEIILLNFINGVFCDSQLKKSSFDQEDSLFKLDDLRQYYEFLDTCYKKLKRIALSDGQRSKCGFIRVNQESVVPYVTNKQDDLAFLPLFYFEGDDASSLAEKGVAIRGWDLAYLKFCCKVQGIRDGIFGCDTCMMVSLDVLKNYFPGETIFEDYWPSELKPARSLSLLKHSVSHVAPQISETEQPFKGRAVADSTSSASEQSVQQVQTHVSSAYPSRKRFASQFDISSTSARCPLLRAGILDHTTPVVNKESLTCSATVVSATPPNFSSITPPRRQCAVQRIRSIRNRNNNFLASHTRSHYCHASNARRQERSFNTEPADVVDLTSPPSSPCSPATFDGERNDDVEVMTSMSTASDEVTTEYRHGAEWCVLNTVSVSSPQGPKPFILLNDIVKHFNTTIPELKFKFQRFLKIKLYRANEEQRKLLFQHQKIASIDEELLLISFDDFNSRFNHLKYLNIRTRYATEVK